MNESDRMIAIIRGNYLAKYFPAMWYRQEARKKANEGKKSALKEQIENRLKKT